MAMSRFGKFAFQVFRQRFSHCSNTVREEKPECWAVFQFHQGRPSVLPLQKQKKQREGDGRDQDSCESEAKRCMQLPYILEICGMSSVIALGWHLSQLLSVSEHKTTVTRTLPDLIIGTALAQPKVYGTKLNVVQIKKLKVTNESQLDIAHEDNHQQASETIANSPDVQQQSDSEIKLNQTMLYATRMLNYGNNIQLAELQNDVGVQLITAAKQGESLDWISNFCKESSELDYQQEAFHCFKESAELGSIKGSYNLGLCYEQGIGTLINLEKAVKYYGKAADCGHVSAQYNLGLLYYYGKGVTIDRTKGLSLICQAARKGLPQALDGLMMLLETNLEYKQGKDSTNSLSVTFHITHDLQQSTRNTFHKSFSEPHSLSLLNCENETKEIIDRPLHY